MKIQKSKKNNNFINLYFSSFNNLNLNNINLKNVKLFFKTSLKRIYEYHRNEKKIVFLNFPKVKSLLLRKKFKDTKHLYISKGGMINGFQSNKLFAFKFFFKRILKTNYGQKKNFISKINKMNKSLELVNLVVNSDFNESASNEYIRADMPLISFKDVFFLPVKKTSLIEKYLITKLNIIYLVLLFSILKAPTIKPKITKTKYKPNMVKKKNFFFKEYKKIFFFETSKHEVDLERKKIKKYYNTYKHNEKFNKYKNEVKKKNNYRTNIKFQDKLKKTRYHHGQQKKSTTEKVSKVVTNVRSSETNNKVKK